MQQILFEGDSYHWRRDRRLAACATAAALLALAGAAGDRGEGYYTFMRIYVSGAAAALAISDWRRGRAWLPLMAALIAILFNPIRPIEMAYPTDWRPFEWGAAAWFVLVGGSSLAAGAKRRLRVSDEANDWAVAITLLVIISIPALVQFARANATSMIDIDRNAVTPEISAADYRPDSSVISVVPTASARLATSAVDEPTANEVLNAVDAKLNATAPAADENERIREAQDLSDRENLAALEAQLNGVGILQRAAN